MDELEKYIKDHRDDLDRYSPGSRSWKMIRSGLTKGRHRYFYAISAAAVIIALLGISVLLKPMLFKLQHREGYKSLVENNPQVRETELYYINLVNDLVSEAKPLLTEHPDMEKELSADMSQLDSICGEIKKDLRDNISNQEVIEALITNYRIRIQILNDMLSVLKNEDDGNANKKNHDL
jgi:predicted transcriptional regulator